MDEPQQVRTKQQVMHAHLLGEVSELLDRIAELKSGIDLHGPVATILKDQMNALKAERDALSLERKRLESLATRIENAPITRDGFDVESTLPESKFPVGTAIFFSLFSGALVIAVINIFPGLLHLSHTAY